MWGLSLYCRYRPIGKFCEPARQDRAGRGVEEGVTLQYCHSTAYHCCTCYGPSILTLMYITLIYLEKALCREQNAYYSAGIQIPLQALSEITLRACNGFQIATLYQCFHNFISWCLDKTKIVLVCKYLTKT